MQTSIGYVLLREPIYKTYTSCYMPFDINYDIPVLSP